jgi:hypothetical protein
MHIVIEKGRRVVGFDTTDVKEGVDAERVAAFARQGGASEGSGSDEHFLIRLVGAEVSRMTIGELRQVRWATLLEF